MSTKTSRYDAGNEKNCPAFQLFQDLNALSTFQAALASSRTHQLRCKLSLHVARARMSMSAVSQAPSEHGNVSRSYFSAFSPHEMKGGVLIQCFDLRCILQHDVAATDALITHAFQHLLIVTIIVDSEAFTPLRRPSKYHRHGTHQNFNFPDELRPTWRRQADCL